MDAALRNRRDDRVIGTAAMALAVVGVVCLAPLPWQVRMPLLSIAALFGPGVPALRLWGALDTTLSVVIGIGVDIALLMVVGQFMILTGLWGPQVAIVLLMAASFFAGRALRARGGEGNAR